VIADIAVIGKANLTVGKNGSEEIAKSPKLPKIAEIENLRFFSVSKPALSD
jgi:hypothetical protein